MEKYYDVEKIVDKKITASGKALYLIKWVGYSSKENTWESLTNLKNVKSMVDEFEIEYSQRGGKYSNKEPTLETDVPKEILDSTIINNRLFMLVKWKKRKSNVQPPNSLVLYPELKKNYPYVVLDFFESNLRLGRQIVKFKEGYKGFNYNSHENNDADNDETE